MLQGQDWMKRVGACLQDKLIHSSVYAENSSCDQISSSSYGFHAPCYVNNGFCDIVLPNTQNLDALFEIVSVRDLAWPPDAVRSICDIIKRCNKLDKHGTCQDDVCKDDINKEGAEGPRKFFTRIAQLVVNYPILRNLACNLYRD